MGEYINVKNVIVPGGGRNPGRNKGRNKGGNKGRNQEGVGVPGGGGSEGGVGCGLLVVTWARFPVGSQSSSLSSSPPPPAADDDDDDAPSRKDEEEGAEADALAVDLEVGVKLSSSSSSVINMVEEEKGEKDWGVSITQSQISITSALIGCHSVICVGTVG